MQYLPRRSWLESFFSLVSVFKFSMRASLAYDPLELFRHASQTWHVFSSILRVRNRASEEIFLGFGHTRASSPTFSFLLRRNSPSVCRDIYDFFPRSKGKYYENICAEKLNMKAMRRCWRMAEWSGELFLIFRKKNWNRAATCEAGKAKNFPPRVCWESRRHWKAEGTEKNVCCESVAVLQHETLSTEREWSNFFALCRRLDSVLASAFFLE